LEVIGNFSSSRSLSPKMSLPLTTGLADFQVGENTYQTHYIVVGDLKSSIKRPLVTLHGGPGLSHHYMLPNQALFSQSGIPVVIYDQIGNGGSSHLPEAPKDFWTPELFMDELDNLLSHLGIETDFDLLGHSWGGMIVAEYAAKRAPKGLKRLIIANSTASIPMMVQGINELLEKIEPGTAEMMRKHELEGTVDSPDYVETLQTFQKKHICSLNPWPDYLSESFNNLAKNPSVYQALWGPMEINIVGSIKDWSIIDILHTIQYPTLLITSPLDEMQEVAYLPFFLNIPKIKWVDIPSSTHLAMYEDPQR